MAFLDRFRKKKEPKQPASFKLQDLKDVPEKEQLAKRPEFAAALERKRETGLAPLTPERKDTTKLAGELGLEGRRAEKFASGEALRRMREGEVDTGVKLQDVGMAFGALPAARAVGGLASKALTKFPNLKKLGFEVSPWAAKGPFPVNSFFRRLPHKIATQAGVSPAKVTAALKSKGLIKADGSLGYNNIKLFVESMTNASLSKQGLGVVGTVAGTDVLVTWYALDNVITGQKFFVNNIRGGMEEGTINSAEARELLEESQATRDRALSLVNTSTTLNPLLMPFRNLIMTGVEADNAAIDLVVQQIAVAGAQKEAGEQEGQNLLEEFGSKEPGEENIGAEHQLNRTPLEGFSRGQRRLMEQGLAIAQANGFESPEFQAFLDKWEEMLPMGYVKRVEGLVLVKGRKAAIGSEGRKPGKAATSE